MPRRRQYQPVQGVPYISTSDPGLTDYYSKILSDRTQRYDTAFQAIQQSQANLADMPSLDVEAKNKVLGSFKERSQAIVDKHGGDYGGAARELSNLVATERENPFYAFNQRQLDQTQKLEQSLAKNPNLHILKDPRSQRFEDFSGNLEDVGYDTVDPEEIRRILAQNNDKLRTQQTELGIVTKYAPGEEGAGYDILRTQLGMSDDQIAKLISSGEMEKLVEANLPQLAKYKKNPEFQKFLKQETSSYAQSLKGGIDEKVLGLSAATRAARTSSPTEPTPVFGGTSNTQAIRNPYINSKKPLKETIFEGVDLDANSEDFDENGNIITKEFNELRKLANEFVGDITMSTFDQRDYERAKKAGDTKAKTLEEFQEENNNEIFKYFNSTQDRELKTQERKQTLNILRQNNPELANMNDYDALNTYKTALQDMSTGDVNKYLFNTLPGKGDLQQITTDRVANDLKGRKLTITESDKKIGSFSGTYEKILEKLDLSKDERAKANLTITGLIPALKSYSGVINAPNGKQYDISVSADNNDQQYLDLLAQSYDNQLQGNTSEKPIWSEGRPYLLTTQIIGGKLKSNLLPLDPTKYTYNTMQSGDINQIIQQDKADGGYDVDSTSPFYAPGGITLNRAEKILMNYYK